MLRNLRSSRVRHDGATPFRAVGREKHPHTRLCQIVPKLCRVLNPTFRLKSEILAFLRGNERARLLHSAHHDSIRADRSLEVGALLRGPGMFIRRFRDR